MDRLAFLNKELGTNYTSLDEVSWVNVSRNIQLSENFIREFQDKIYWHYISEYQKLSENFIREFQDKVNWTYISERQNLSEEFIREFQGKVDWNCISCYQKLSENFIREFQNKVNWNYISKYQKLSPEFIKEFDLNIDKNNWLYKSIEFKKNKIVDCGLYECHEDYFIAYKAIRNDRYSCFNFQYQYLPNEVYECNCDCTDDENSFGLSVWTEKGAKSYDNTGLIVKVKVRYEDIGRLVHNSNKVRCSKIEILE